MLEVCIMHREIAALIGAYSAGFACAFVLIVMNCPDGSCSNELSGHNVKWDTETSNAGRCIVEHAKVLACANFIDQGVHPTKHIPAKEIPPVCTTSMEFSNQRDIKVYCEGNCACSTFEGIC